MVTYELYLKYSLGFSNSAQKDYTADHNCASVYTVEDVRTTIRLARGRELPLPGKPQYDACESYILKSVNQWEAPAKECVQHVQGQLEELVVGTRDNSLLDTIPARFRPLRERAREIIYGLVAELGAVTLDRVHDLCVMQNHLFTFNEEAVAKARTEFIATIKAMIDKEDTESKFNRMEETLRFQLLDGLQRLGMTKERLLMFSGLQQVEQHVRLWLVNEMFYCFRLT